MSITRFDSHPRYTSIDEVEEDLRGRLEPMPRGGLSETTGVCVDARAALKGCPIYGRDRKLHPVRYHGSIHGMCTDLVITQAIDDPASFEAATDKSHEISHEVSDAFNQKGGPRQTVHINCADMLATPETVATMAIPDARIHRLASKILEESFKEVDYLKVVQGSGMLVSSRRIEHHEPTVLRHHRRRIPVGKLHDTTAIRQAFVFNRTGLLLPPMEYDEHDQPKHSLVYDSDETLVLPKLIEIGRELLTPRMKSHTHRRVFAVHAAVLAKKKLGFPDNRIIILH